MITRLRGSSGLRAWIACSCIFLAITTASAQSSTDRVPITGTIADRSGGALPDAIVAVVVAGRTVSISTTARDGRYQVEAPAGVPFALRVRREGFADQAIEMRGIAAAMTRDVTLQLGGISDTLVVTATRAPASRASLTSAVTVMAAPEIQALGSTSLADIMRFVPGLAAEGNGREGAMTTVFSRGGESDYNLVLIDGVRVNQGGGLFDFSRVAAGEIARVEVVRGAQSSLWGSDAMGAVVQIFTRPDGAAGAPRLSANVEAGSFNTFRGDARASGSVSRVDYSGAVTHRRTDGAFADRLLAKDQFEQTAYDGSLGVALGSRATARTTLRYSDADGANVGSFVYGRSNTGGAYETKDFSWTASLAHSLGARYTGSASVNYFRYQSFSADTVADPTFFVFALLEGRPGALFPDSPRLVRLLTQPEFASFSATPGSLGTNQFVASTPFGVSNFPFTFQTQFRRPAVRYQGDVVWGGNQRLSAGYEWERERGWNPPSAARFEQENNAFFVQQQFNWQDRWFATVGARVDDKDQYDTFFSPKLSAGGFLVPFRPGPLSSVKAFFNIGKGIKTPQFSERFGGSFADGNPDLKVERARSIDAGVELTLDDQHVRTTVTYFDNRFRDQVEFRVTNPSFLLDGLPDFINVAGARATGAELEVLLQRPIAGFTAGATYALVDTEVQETTQTGVQFQPGQPLLRRPKHSGTFRAAYTAGMVTANLNARFVGERHDAAFLGLRAVPNGSFITAPVSTDITYNPGYTVVGAGVDLRVHDGLTVFGRVDNVGDTAFQSALGFAGLPRAFVAGARLDLRR